MPAPTEPAAPERSYSHAAGEEPLKGYVLLGPLGRGGFGEVWKAEAPGGLHKAIKFVSADPELTGHTGSQALKQEFEAFQTIKMIRHPFLLTLERVELLDGELVMVMELADEHLQDRFTACRAEGHPGIPRSELLGYLADAAEALDVIGTRYGLQHLDVKPANLFVVCGRAKVGDYGLVTRMTVGDARPTNTNRGLTPRYVAPEVLRGTIDGRSDQYSLALVYQELLTDTFAYTAKNAQQMMMMHVSGKPDLTGLPEYDRAVVSRALSKNPAERFPSCLALVHALMAAGRPAAGSETMGVVTDTMFDLVRQARMTQSASDMKLPSPVSGPLPLPPLRTRPVPPAFGAPAATPVPAPQPVPPPPPLTTLTRKTASKPVIDLDEPLDLILAPAGAPAPVRLAEIRSVLTLATLAGRPDAPPGLWADQLIEAVVSAAANGPAPRLAADPVRRPDGLWAVRFPTTLLPTVVPLKLGPLLEDDWFDELDQPGPGLFVLRRYAATGVWGKLSGKKHGMELVLRWPTRQGAGEAEATVGVFGQPDATFARGVEQAVPGVLGELRQHLCNVDDRRKHPRVRADLPMKFVPLDDSGAALPPVPARLVDVSLGGLAAKTPTMLPSRYAFAAFDLPGPVGSAAVLVRVTREQQTVDGVSYGGRFRTDL